MRPARPLIKSKLPCFRIVALHHKTERSNQNFILEMALPYDEAVALDLYFRYAYPVLNPSPHNSTTAAAAAAAAAAGPSTSAAPPPPRQHQSPGHNLVFMQPRNGKPFENALSTWYKELQARLGAPWKPFPPSHFRHLHVRDQVRSLAYHTATAPPTQLEHMIGTAVGMQNHTGGNVWQLAYCTNAKYFNEMCKAVVDRITTWRLDHLTAVHHYKLANGGQPPTAASRQPQPQAAAAGGAAHGQAGRASEDDEASDFCDGCDEWDM